jgi:hypothetical protein
MAGGDDSSCGCGFGGRSDCNDDVDDDDDDDEGAGIDTAMRSVLVGVSCISAARVPGGWGLVG